MKTDRQGITMRSLLRAFADNRGAPLMITTLHKAKRRQLIDMYLAYQPRNSFSGLPPIKDGVCVQWVEKMVATGINLVALSLDKGVVGHVALFPIDRAACEMLAVVSPPCQNLGIGSELIRCSIELARQRGFRTIRLVVESSNYVARHVYEKCGFECLSHDLSGELDMALDVQRHTGAVDAGI